jgi:hypothetical protein
MVKYEIRLDLSGVDLAALQTDGDFRREAARLLPAALEELGQALGEAAWERQRTDPPSPPVKHPAAAGELRTFVEKAGRTYRRFAPARDRQALEDLLIRQLRQAKSAALAATRDDGSTVPLA